MARWTTSGPRSSRIDRMSPGFRHCPTIESDPDTELELAAGKDASHLSQIGVILAVQLRLEARYAGIISWISAAKSDEELNI
jgi:hypothetical protein